MASSLTWAFLAVLCLGLACPALAEFGALLAMPQAARAGGVADFIVVLGGETVERVREAARLYGAGRAPRLLVSGAGDCLANRDGLIAAGVPPAAIAVDCASTSTWENAAHARAVFERIGTRRVLLVTSWFHAPRAYACFARADGAVDYAVASVQAEDEELWSTDGARRLASEYVKAAWYLVRYGVFLPAGREAASPAAPPEPDV